MIVLDCDAAVAMVMMTDEGRALSELTLKDEKIVSTSFIQAELASVFTKYVRAGYFDKERLLHNYGNAIRLIDSFIPLEENIIESLVEGIRLGHSPYDMLYFTLARRNGATLYTLDRKLINLCVKEGIDCVRVCNSEYIE
jgi:predicted nucleic acid-binding protein